MQTKRLSRTGDAEGEPEARSRDSSRNTSKKRQLNEDVLSGLKDNPNVDWNEREQKVIAERPDEPRQADEKKHIHPCICDIDKRRMAAIREHLKHKRIAQQRYESRVRQIEEEFRLAEEAELEKLRQLEEEKELYGDEYEQKGKTKVRKKRSARRASMVSLGVKQVINWQKSPKIKVKYTKTARLRKENPTYCKSPISISSPRHPVKWNDYPKIPIRTTKTVTLRSLEVQNRLASFQKAQTVIKYPNRPPFRFSSFV